MSESEGSGFVRRDVVTGPPAGREGAPARPSESSPVPDEELSPWYGDLVDDRPPQEGDLSPDVPEPAPPKPPRRPNSLHIDAFTDEGVPAPYFLNKRKHRRLAKPLLRDNRVFTPEQRVLILDTWIRSGLPAGEFAPLVMLSKHTLYAWKKRFEELGPAGLVDQPRKKKKGSRLPEVTKRAILMIKETNPEYGVQRISDMLLRGPALPASPGAVARVLHEAGYVCEFTETKSHPDKMRSFERARPNQLWQTDLFTFMLKRQNRRVHLVAFMDDHSRYITGFGLHATASTALVLEALGAAIASYGTPEEILTDNGPQYVTWRGKSAFTKECEKRGIKQIRSRPRHPQTLGKIERFWGTLWRECVERAVFVDLGDARRRIGLFVDHYNFQRPHSACKGLSPSDRYFGTASELLQTLKSRVVANALAIARDGAPKVPFYLTGNVNGKPFSVHAEGERLLLKRDGEEAKEIELASRRDGEALAGEVPVPDPVGPAIMVGETPAAEQVSSDESADAEIAEAGFNTADDEEEATAAVPDVPSSSEQPEAPGYTFLGDRLKRIRESSEIPNDRQGE